MLYEDAIGSLRSRRSAVGRKHIYVVHVAQRVEIKRVSTKGGRMALFLSGALAPPTICAASTSLFLDFDGTLVELVDRPETVTVSASLRTLLERLVVKFEARLAVVSGRSVAQLRDFFGPLVDRLALVGSHGGEVRIPGSEVIAPDRPPALREAEHVFAKAFTSKKGVLIEVKTLGVAIHYRLDPSAEAAAERIAQEFASAHGLELQRGKMMVEVRSPGHDKGSGIGALMSKPPFKGSQPIFLGDDLTDEPGFSHSAELGGFGILVGPRRPTAARYWLAEVAAVHDWLAAI